jgi:hypothetical protein
MVGVVGVVGVAEAVPVVGLVDTIIQSEHDGTLLQTDLRIILIHGDISF